MTFVSRHTGTIVRGDIIAIAFDNTIHLMFYVGRGKNTVQYYALAGLAWHEDNDPNTPPGRWSKGYINAPHVSRIMKVNLKDLSYKTLVQHEKATRYLERHGIKLNEE